MNVTRVESDGNVSYIAEFTEIEINHARNIMGNIVQWNDGLALDPVPLNSDEARGRMASDFWYKASDAVHNR